MTLRPWLLSVLVAGGLSTAAWAASVQEADRLAISGDNQAAIALYREVLAADPLDATSHYNLGTLLAEAGKPGEAGVHLHQALRLRPDFEDARYNTEVLLKEARGFDAMPGATRAVLSPVLEGINNRGLHLVFWLGLMVLAASIALWPVIPRPGRTVVLAIAALSGILGAVAGWESEARQASGDVRWAVVLSADTPVRLGPADEGKTRFMAPAGVAGRVVESQNHFVRLRFNPGLDGWVEKDAVEILPQLNRSPTD